MPSAEYIACQLQLNEFDSVPKLKSVTSRPHQNGIAAEELESIQLALEDQLSWAVRRKKFLEDNLSALQEDPGSLVVNTTSTFPYSGLDTNSAQLGPNCGAARTVPVGSPKIDPTSRFAPYITSPASSLSPNKSDSPRKDNQAHFNAQTVPVSSSYASISPVENLSKTKSEVPHQFWKYVDEVYCCKISSDNLKRTLLPVCNNYEDSELSKFFEVPSAGDDRDSTYSSSGSLSGANDVNGNSNSEDNGVSPSKRPKTSNKRESANTKKKQSSKSAKVETAESASELCSIGPLTQLLISSLIHPSNVQVSKLYKFGVAETDVNISNVATVLPKLDGAKDTWLRYREECRLENIARKELKKLGFLDSLDGTSVGEDDDSASPDGSSSTNSVTSRIMPSVRVDCTDEVLCALRAKQCELDILVDANKVGLKHLYSKCQESLTQQQLEEKADLLDSKIKDQYAKLLQCKASKKLLSKKEQEHMTKLLEEWKAVYVQLNLL